MLGERVLSHSEVIRAILLEDSPCCGVPHRVENAALRARGHPKVSTPAHTKKHTHRGEYVGLGAAVSGG